MLGADRSYDTRDFVWRARALGATPHVAQNDRERRRFFSSLLVIGLEPHDS